MAQIGDAVDRDACMGSGNCVFWAPGVFDLDDDGIAVVVGDPRAAKRMSNGCGELPDGGHTARRTPSRNSLTTARSTVPPTRHLHAGSRYNVPGRHG